MRSSFVLAALLVLAPVLARPPALPAQASPSPALQEAYFAWDEGRYLEAVEGYLRVLDGPDGARHVEELARLTGELHPVRAVDEDGRGLAISPDGSHLLWTRQMGEEWVIRVAPREGGEIVTVPGRSPALSASGLLAYLAEDGLRVRRLSTGAEEVRELPGLLPVALAFAPDRDELFLTAGRVGEGDRLRLFRLAAPGWEPEVLDLGPGHQAGPLPVPGGRYLVFQRPEDSPLPVPEGEDATETPDPGIGAVDLETGRRVSFAGSSPSVSADGSYLAFLRRDEDGPARLLGLPLPAAGLPGGQGTDPETLLEPLVETGDPLANPAVSPDGSRVAFQLRPHRSWEILLVHTDGSRREERVTREVQHDQFPAWVDPGRLLAMKGEFRHRRAFLYDLESGDHYRLFHNNTLRTITPEYEWVADPRGEGVLLVAERDGDTISPERGVWWVDLTRTVTRDELRERLRASLEAEAALLEGGRELFAPVAGEVRTVTERVSPSRIYHYAEALHSFGTKFFTEPGNARAREYLAETLESWGYEVELEWFEARGVRTANVVATLPGTRDPDLVYVISSHFDSVLRSPGADDNSSGTTALLEAARVLRDNPRAATLQFAFLTAEEAGLLGAREFVRRAVDEGKRVVGVLNNDMIGWTRSHRLDNTIRYSNPGIKDIQHAASHFFSDLITYDALYYRGTDAAVFFDAYGDIVGGIGSYPVLGNPNYHQATDELWTINQRLVAEVSRTTVATVMLLADSPSRLEGLRVAESDGEGVTVAWAPAPEAGVTGYRVRVRRGEAPWRELGPVAGPRARIPAAPGPLQVEVRAVRDNGTEGWDWARLEER